MKTGAVVGQRATTPLTEQSTVIQRDGTSTPDPSQAATRIGTSRSTALSAGSA
jgi:hypothetical protein